VSARTFWLVEFRPDVGDAVYFHRGIYGLCEQAHDGRRFRKYDDAYKAMTRCKSAKIEMPLGHWSVAEYREKE
jgi:hypothetical protein